ncbi:MAG: spermidine synthase [Methylotenera sp.]|nr:MAG: spermidine synthase [Methylotenera sp.]
MFRFNRKIHKSVRDDSVLEVSEIDGIRSLHLGTVTIQSSMKVKDPFALELTYTRGMMGFLLFSDDIKTVLTIGLGGGSVPKYIYANCPSINQTIVEINPQIINIARSHFYVPDNDERFNVIEGDGIAYLAENTNSTDCLMIDAFDSFGIPPDFCSQDFFDSCEMALKNNGIFAINLWGSDKNFDIYLQRIEQSFNNQTFMLPTGKPGNIVVFGFKKPLSLTHKKLKERAKNLENTHKIEFSSFVDKLCEHNQIN